MKILKVLFLLLLGLLIGCEQKQHEEQTLHLNLCDDPVSLDPRVVRSSKDLTLMKQMYEGLYRLDAEGIPQPALAESVAISDDLLTYTFTLREAYWSDHTPVTASDFERAWTQVLDPSFASDYSHMLYPIKNGRLAREGRCPPNAVGVEAINERTLCVQLETPTPYFLELVSFPTYFPVNHARSFVYNGPFSLKKWIPQTELVLEKNRTYWDQSSVNLDSIVFSIIDDTNTEAYLFEKEELDWLGQPISRNIISDLLGKMKKEWKFDSYPVAGTFWIKFNTEKEPFDDPRVRKAFSYAMNRQQIITHILQGNQTIATGPVPPFMTINEEPYFQDGDVIKARKLIKEVMREKGWTVATFPKIILNFPPIERNLKIMQLLQQQWHEALGIHVELEAQEFQLYRSNTKQGLYQMGTGDWIADYNDPLTFLEIFKYRNDNDAGNGMNDTGWQNEEFSTLLEHSLLEKDSKARKSILNRAEKILVEEMPVAPIYHYSFDYAKKPHVENVVLSPFGTADFKTAKIAR